MFRLSSLAPAAMLVVLGSCAARPAPVGASSRSRSCSSAILTLGRPGDRRRELYQDGHGHTIELWCTNGVLASQWDLRIGGSTHNDVPQNVAVSRPVASGKALTIGGCFFDNGTNVGPAIVRNPDGSFAKVAWTNHSTFGKAETYLFSYDFRTNLVTITLSTPCGVSVSKVVPPQESYAKMAALLPQLRGSACRSGIAQPAAAP